MVFFLFPFPLFAANIAGEWEEQCAMCETPGVDPVVLIGSVCRLQCVVVCEAGEVSCVGRVALGSCVVGVYVAFCVYV